MTTRSAAIALLTGAALSVSGCGNNVADLIYQGVAAAGNTALDLWLTDFANNVADQLNPPPGGDENLPDGDANAGEQTYIAKACGVCHGDNAEGGTGPALAGVNELENLTDLFGDGAVHRSRTMTDDEVENVATWLLTLESNGGGGGEVPNGDAAAGETAYMAQDCAACHGANGEGGSAPALADMNKFAELKTRFSNGASHFGRTLTDTEIEDVATWLLGDSGGGGQSAGEQAFVDAGCSACHGAMAGGGVGPALAGMDELAALQARLGGGASHNGATLSDADITAVAAWLESL